MRAAQALHVEGDFRGTIRQRLGLPSSAILINDIPAVLRFLRHMINTGNFQGNYY